MAAYQLYDTGLTVTREDKLLSLSTCKYSSRIPVLRRMSGRWVTTSCPCYSLSLAVRCKNNKIRIKKRSQKRKFFAVYLWSKKLPFVYRGGRGGVFSGGDRLPCSPWCFRILQGRVRKSPCRGRGFWVICRGRFSGRRGSGAPGGAGARANRRR